MLKKVFKADCVATQDLQPENPWQYCEPMADDIGALAIGSDDESFPLERTIVGVLADITEQGCIFMAPYESGSTPSLTVKHALVRRRSPVDQCCGCDSESCQSSQTTETPAKYEVASSPRSAVLVEEAVARYTQLLDKIDQAVGIFQVGVMLCEKVHPAERELADLSKRVALLRGFLKGLR